MGAWISKSHIKKPPNRDCVRGIKKLRSTIYQQETSSIDEFNEFAQEVSHLLGGEMNCALFGIPFMGMLRTIFL
jgi:hypothetical protein